MAGKSAARARFARPRDREVGTSGVRRVARQALGRIPAGRSPVFVVRAVAEGDRRVAGSLGPGTDGGRKPRQQKSSTRTVRDHHPDAKVLTDGRCGAGLPLRALTCRRGKET